MRIALAQLNPVVGDVAGNLALIVDAVKVSRREGSQALVTSELALIGYPPRDLLLREGVVSACEEAVQRIADAAGEMYVLIGHPRRQAGGTRPLRNSVSICRDGQVLAVYDKQLLPGYDVFDEDRYFEPGADSLVTEIAGVRCGIVICEDLWRATDVTAERRYPIEPVSDLIAQGCAMLVSLNASPFVLGKWQKHVRQLREIATEHRIPVIAINQVGANDDQVFDGRSLVIAADGGVMRVMKGFDSEISIVDVPAGANAEPAPFVDIKAATREIEKWSSPPREIFHALTLGIRDYCDKTGHRDVLLGLSGGVDSALVAALACAAVGAAHVHGVMMPSKFSSAGSVADAIDLAKRLRLASNREVSIKDLHAAIHARLADEVGMKAAGVTDENVQARLRGVLLMAMSNAIGGLVLATSNKSEMAVGYGTLYGDMCGALAPLGDVTKTRIYELCRWINGNFAECGFDQPPIPQSSIDKPPSAELRPNQTDQDSLPPYEVLDEIIERRIELEQSEAMIVAESGIDGEIVQQSLKMIDRAQFKRDQAPVVLKITGRAFGPGRQMPIVSRENLGHNQDVIAAAAERDQRVNAETAHQPAAARKR